MAEETENKKSSGSSGDSNKSDDRSSRGRSSGSSNRGGGGRRGGYRGRYQPRRRVCAFCADKDKVIDWKRHDILRRFVDDQGSIKARRKTGTCAKHQRALAVAIKRARHMALFPFTGEHARLMRG